MSRSKRRIYFLDEVRGFSLILMIFFHAFYLVGYSFDMTFCRDLFDFFLPAQPLFGGLVIFICGISCNLSRNNVKRGLLLLGAAVLLSGVMWCAVFWRMLSADNQIWFGILHLLAVCILLYALLRPALSRVAPWLGLIVCTILFVLCYFVPHSMGGYFGIRGLFTVAVPPASFDHPLLYAFGLCPTTPCGDYVPLIPWMFCFFAGTFVGVWAAKRKFPKWTYRNRFPLFSALGRHTLLIYLFHQPILYVLCEVVKWVIKRVF